MTFKAKPSYLKLKADTAAQRVVAKVEHAVVVARVLVGYFFRIFTAEDTATLSDSQARDFTKALSDVAATQELINKQTARYPQDTFVVTDATLRTIEKAISDIVTAIDVASLVRQKGAVDSASVTEAKAIEFGRSIADSVSRSDTVTKNFGRAVADTASSSETVLRTPGKRPSDTVVSAEAGSLVSQGYCDINYFATDYVGTSRSF